jgi:ubiquinone/menaquinone biosynthesis C-methylase UbiE
VDELASAVNVDNAALYRLMRALTSVGIYVENQNKSFGLNPMSELLRSDTPNSLRDIAIFMGEEWHWKVWAKLINSIQTGKTGWPLVHGQEVFPYFEANKEASAIFDKAMTSLSSLAIHAVINGYSFEGIDTLVDVAGGHGRLLVSIMEANPSMRGVLFDQPHVISGAQTGLANSTVADRLEFVGGDFFVSVPSADAYIMKYIIHDWDDERSIEILKNIKKAMRPGGRVLLVESILQAPNTPDFGKVMDLEMLVSPGGKERTAEEYEELFNKAGLRLKRIVPTQSPYSVIEAGE